MAFLKGHKLTQQVSVILKMRHDSQEFDIWWKWNLQWWHVSGTRQSKHLLFEFWSFARGHPDDHLQEAGPSRWSFARGQSIQMIICNWPVHPDDHCCWKIDWDADRLTNWPTNQQGEFSAICLSEGWKIDVRDLQYSHHRLLLKISVVHSRNKKEKRADALVLVQKHSGIGTPWEGGSREPHQSKIDQDRSRQLKARTGWSSSSSSFGEASGSWGGSIGRYSIGSGNSSQCLLGRQYWLRQWQ